MGLIPGSGKSPGEGHGNSLQYACLGNSKDRGALWFTVHGAAKIQIWLKRLRTHALIYKAEIVYFKIFWGESHHRMWETLCTIAPKEEKLLFVCVCDGGHSYCGCDSKLLFSCNLFWSHGCCKHWRTTWYHKRRSDGCGQKWSYVLFITFTSCISTSEVLSLLLQAPT